MKPFLRLEFKDESDWRHSYLRNGEVKTAGVELFCIDSIIEMSAITSRGNVSSGHICMTPDNFAAVCRMFLAEYDDDDRATYVEAPKIAALNALVRQLSLDDKAYSDDRDVFEQNIATGGDVFRVGPYVVGIVRYVADGECEE